MSLKPRKVFGEGGHLEDTCSYTVKYTERAQYSLDLEMKAKYSLDLETRAVSIEYGPEHQTTLGR